MPVESGGVLVGSPPDPGEDGLVPAGLLEVVAGVSDPRHRRGRSHDSATIVLLAVAATLAGARSFAAIGEWVADAPRTVLARLGVTGRPPSESTIRRLLHCLDGDGLDAALGAWMWLRSRTIGGMRVLSFDGKTVRRCP